MNHQLAATIKAKAQELGFNLVGITGAEPSVFAAEYREWLANGCAGEMDYLARNTDRRLDPRDLLPDARSIIAVGMNYYTEQPITNSQHQTPNTEHQPPNNQQPTTNQPYSPATPSATTTTM